MGRAEVRAVCRAILTQRSASAPRVSARSQCRGAQVGAREIAAEMRAEDSGQCRHVGQRDDDVLVEPTSAHQSLIEF
jgi:hypothetical protein